MLTVRLKADYVRLCYAVGEWRVCAGFGARSPNSCFISERGRVYGRWCPMSSGTPLLYNSRFLNGQTSPIS